MDIGMGLRGFEISISALRKCLPGQGSEAFIQAIRLGERCHRHKYGSTQTRIVHHEMHLSANFG
ncbi:MAG: hypothetical protein Q7V00_06715 [Sulfurimicrobium sp.]|nr:hypothetical protein [Sulfurimicrobium sp.]MDP1705913.1 hypothetical protein [Sulfurimicrobium sp.]MDP2199872.1 hypothetical protein [Sulfurimicrobium sp.]